MALRDIGEKPGTGRYCCTNCDWAVALDDLGDRLPTVRELRQGAGHPVPGLLSEGHDAASARRMNVTNIVTFMRSTLERLWALADAHGGYFTTAEAREAGISRRALSHHASTGTIERVEHGIYRLTLYPSRRFEDYIIATLWAGSDAAISHESALVVYGLSDAMPAKVHLTLPRRFRGNREGVIVHHAPLSNDERSIVDDVPVTSVERTLGDVAASSDPGILHQALREALERGLTSRRRLERSLRGHAMLPLIVGDSEPT